MAIPENEIETGWVYRAHQKQDRLVLGRDRDGLVVYVSKGRTDAPAFHNCHVRVTAKKFAQRATARVEQVPDLQRYIVANKATTVVVRPRRKAAG